MLTFFSCWGEGPGREKRGGGPPEAGGPRAEAVSKGELRRGALRRGPCGEQGSAGCRAGRPVPDRRSPGDLEESGCAGPGRRSSRTRTGGEQRQGEALRHGGALGVEGLSPKGKRADRADSKAPGRLAVPAALGVTQASFCLKNGNRASSTPSPQNTPLPPPSYSSPRLSPPIRQGSDPVFIPGPLNLSPLPGFSRPFWALHTPRPAPSLILSPSLSPVARFFWALLTAASRPPFPPLPHLVF